MSTNERTCYDCAHLRVCKFHEAGERARPPHTSDLQIRPFLTVTAQARAIACDVFLRTADVNANGVATVAAKSALELLDDAFDGDIFRPTESGLCPYDEHSVNAAHRVLVAALRVDT